MDLKLSKAVTAIRSIFFVCGLALSGWAPMVPFAKIRLGLDDAGLGILLLLLGAGAITMMPICGMLSYKYGNRIIISISAAVIAVTLPLLAVLDGVFFMGAVLLLFGAGIGTIDVAMNASGVQLQNLSGRSIMSSLHGLFSIGGLFGSLGLGLLIKVGLEPLYAAICLSLLVVLTAGLQYKNLFSVDMEKQAESTAEISNSGASMKWSWLQRGVLFLGLLCFIVFMVEGAMLDWSALFLFENKEIDESWSGLGYAFFSTAMAGMRLFGDRIVEKYNSVKVVTIGAIVAGTGLLLGLLSPVLSLSLIGFFMLGCGAANIVPVFFNEAGRLKNIKTSTAVAAITTIGYSGQLMGPVAVGFIAHAFSLLTALGICAGLLFMVAVLFAIKYWTETKQNVNGTIQSK